MILIAENVLMSPGSYKAFKLPRCSVVSSVAELLRHPTGNLETQVRFLAEQHFHSSP